jgi:hypothetical protein
MGKTNEPTRNIFKSSLAADKEDESSFLLFRFHLSKSICMHTQIGSMHYLRLIRGRAVHQAANCGTGHSSIAQQNMRRPLAHVSSPGSAHRSKCPLETLALICEGDYIGDMLRDIHLDGCDALVSGAEVLKVIVNPVVCHFTCLLASFFSNHLMSKVFEFTQLLIV